MLLLMDNDIPVDTPPEELMNMPDLNLDLLTRPPLTDFTPYYMETVQQKLRVPRRLAEFFIESFALDEAPQQIHISPKRFPERGALIQFQIPAVVPIFVTGESRTITFCFFNTPLISANDTERIVKRRLNVLSQRSLLVVHFERVDSRGFAQADIDAFANDLDVRVLVEFGRVDTAIETRDLTMFVMKSHWDPELEALVREEIDRLYAAAALNYCGKCGLLFAAGDQECVIKRHAGERIQFDDGQWELVEFEEGDDEPMTIVRWSCCGEVPIDEPGCLSEPAGAHEPDPEKPFSSEVYGEEKMI